MTAQFELYAEAAEGSASLLVDVLHSAGSVLVKKLSNNDRDWAQLPNKHQHGVYIPPEQRDSGFFPPLVIKERDDPAAADIREIYFRTEWPQVGTAKDETRLVHYTSKGAETHITGVPKAAFSTLLPASYLVMGRYPAGDAAIYRCLTIDSASDDALLLVDLFRLDGNFVIGIFEPQAYLNAERDRIVDFAELVIAAWLAGDIAKFAIENAAMPRTLELAAMAREQYLAQRCLPDLNPFALDRPGDAVREISRGIEWDLFREYQRRERATSLVRTVLGDHRREITTATIIRGLIDNIAEIDRLMLSASQQRKSRAGYSFEHHIEAVLTAGNLPFAKQVVMDAKKRPDFVLPSLRQLKRPKHESPPGIILSAKTTLRERWKQVQREMAGSELFLATVDESIAANAIEDMAALGIVLVVPESLKSSTDTEYVRHENVISFKAFFEIEIAANRLPGWS